MALWDGIDIALYYTEMCIYLFALQEVKDRKKVGEQLNRSNRTQ